MAPPIGLVPSCLPPPKGLLHGDVILDIGAGLRPMPWYTPARHLCVEPHGPYADRLEAAGYKVLRTTATAALDRFEREGSVFDAIYMLDVIEHMPRGAGRMVLNQALALKPKQIVVFTPDGFWPQEDDAWELGGEEWQKHRSGWTPSDFPGWEIEHWNVNQFFAIWTRP